MLFCGFRIFPNILFYAALAAISRRHAGARAQYAASRALFRGAARAPGLNTRAQRAYVLACRRRRHAARIRRAFYHFVCEHAQFFIFSFGAPFENRPGGLRRICLSYRPGCAKCGALAREIIVLAAS